MPDPGPFATEEEARAYARTIVSLGPGALSPAENTMLLHVVLGECGVRTGDFDGWDEEVRYWLTQLEDSIVAVIAAWVVRAYQAGQSARPEETSTEYRLRIERPHEDAFVYGPDHGAVGLAALHETARSYKRVIGIPAVIESRQVAEWKEIPA